MKRKIIFLFVLVGTLAFFFTSCEPEKEEPNTTEDARDKFVGNWLCTEKTGVSYPVFIEKISDSKTDIRIKNFHHFGDNEFVIATVAGFSLTIPKQPACDGAFIVEGTALMASNKKNIQFTYSVNDGANSEEISATYTKN